MAVKGWGVAEGYVHQGVNFTEAIFVVVVMTISSTRPVLDLAERALGGVARLGKRTPLAWWLSILTIGPLAGSFITEPAAMSICAILIGRQLFDPLPWTIPMIWLVALLASRGTARLVLRPWRNTPNYGYWLIGTAALLVVVLDLGLEPFAVQVHRPVRQLPCLGRDRFADPRFCHAGTHQQEADAAAPAGLSSADRLAPDQPALCDRCGGKSTVAGVRGDMRRQPGSRRSRCAWRDGLRREGGG